MVRVPARVRGVVEIEEDAGAQAVRAVRGPTARARVEKLISTAYYVGADDAFADVLRAVEDFPAFRSLLLRRLRDARAPVRKYRRELAAEGRKGKCSKR